MAESPTVDRIVDLHTHGLPPALPEFGKRYAGSWPELVATGPCTADLTLGGTHFRSIDDHSWDPARRIEDMDAEEVAMQVVSPIPVTFSYGLPAQGVAELARVQNDWIADVVRDRPDRFRGLGSVPLQDPAVAATMVGPLVHELGLSGVEIGSNVNGAGLDDPALEPFFAACEEAGALVFVHPWQPLGADGLTAHGLLYSVGYPTETAFAAASLVMGGVLDRHPGLDILLAHGGGTFLPLLSRIDRTWANLPGAAEGGAAAAPSEYVRRFHYDSLVYEPAALAALVDRVGADRVAIGTDYPFPIAERPAGAALADAGLSPADVTAVRAGTARRLLRLS